MALWKAGPVQNLLWLKRLFGAYKNALGAVYAFFVMITHSNCLSAILFMVIAAPGSRACRTYSLCTFREGIYPAAEFIALFGFDKRIFFRVRFS